jgi:cysteine desulfurase / selenocysteine lyase
MDIQKIRDQFPILKREINNKPLVYFDNAATTQKPVRVVESIVDFYYKHNANIHRGVHTLSVEATDMVDKSRKEMADFIGANPNEVIFLRNATEALNLIMYTLGEREVRSGDNLVITMMEHHSNLVPWQMLCKKKNAEFRVAEIDEEGKLLLQGKMSKQGDYIVGGIMNLIDSKTKLVVLSMASNVTGVINPIKRIIDEIRKINERVYIVLDASQIVGHMEINVNKTGGDFVVFSGHKMYGPTGVGVLWGKKEILNTMPPFLYGGDMISEVRLSETFFAQIPNKFEAGTPAIAEIVALGEAVRFLQELGMNEINKREQELLDYLFSGLKKLEQKNILKIIGPKNTVEHGALLSFVVSGVHAHDVATYLDSKGIAIRSGQHCAAVLVKSFGEIATARISLCFFNTTQEIDYCIECIEESYNYFVK